MQSKKIIFSVFTATYNRGHLLRNVYNSLLAQHFQDFEWVVINDGSDDDTDDIMQSIIDEKKLAILYQRQDNGGKHKAWMAAMRLFRGRYIVTADDDDVLLPTALQVYSKYWEELEKSPNYNSFWEIRTRCAKDDGTLVGKQLPKPFFDSDYNTLNYKYKFDFCEMNACRKLTVLKELAYVPQDFPFCDKVSNFPEKIRWSRASRKYLTRFVPDITRIYLTTEDSLASANFGRKRSVKKTYNTLVGAIFELNESRDLMLKYNVRKYLFTIMTIRYTSLCLHENAKKFIMCKSDKYIYSLLYLPMKLVQIIRK